ncbi:MAG: AMP-binding protein, partial [Planctomycetota bacterium]
DRETFIRRWEGKPRAVVKYQGWLKRLSIEGRRLRKLSAQARQIEQVIYFAKIYSPYTHLDCRFADDGLRALADRMHSDDRREFPFDPGQVDWDDYIVNRHVPGLRAFVLGTAAEPSPRMSGVGEQPMDQPTSPAANLFDLFHRSADRFPDKPALQIRRDGRWICYSYDESLRATGTIMRRFQERGLVAGDRVVICAENGPDWGLTYLAAMRAGLTAVPLDPQLPPAEAWSAARYAKAKLVCAGRTTFAGLREQRVPGDVALVAMDDTLIPPPSASRDLASDPIPVDRATVASILFTSGTTVAPKAVPLTHGNFMANADALLAVHSIGPADEFLSVLPMYHVFEFTGGFLIPLLSGATITYVDQLKGAEIVSAMQATGTTIMLVVPRLLRMFYDSIENAAAAGGSIRRTAFRALGRLSDWSGHNLGRRLFGAVHKNFGGRLRMLVCGGSRLEPELFLGFRRMGFTVYEGYGLTETSPVLTLNPPGSPRAGSVGPALPNIELDVRNANLEGIGEVWARGPSVMSGYLDNPEATREVLVDGWLRTGDLGRREADGYLHLTGRANDLIVTGAGKNVYPDEVEARYAELPFAKEICVFGVPSEDGMGDIVHAVVVVEEAAAPGLDRSSIEREIRLAAATIGESLPTHQRIAKLHFWDRELPMTSTLKAKRGLVRDLVRSER